MKRPPDRKRALAAVVLLVAAGLVLVQPAIGVPDNQKSLETALWRVQR